MNENTVIEREDIHYRDMISPVYIGRNILPKIGVEIKKMSPSLDVALITDSNVNILHGKLLCDIIRSVGLNIHHLNLDINNNIKTISTAEVVYQFLDDIHADWSCPVVILGGSVTIDCAGFAAATFHRGLNYLTIPTTLVSQVDGSIGGALGVHFNNKTNYIGTRVLPNMVWCDVGLLDTLPIEERRAGISEVIKQALVADYEMFIWLESMSNSVLDDTYSMYNIVRKTIHTKSKLVKTGDDQFLNFGHTIAHALENLMEHKNIRHGEAVAIGMCGEASLAEASGYLPTNSANRIKDVLKKFDLPTTFPSHAITLFPTEDDFCNSMFDMIWRDKKVFNHILKWVTPMETLGNAGHLIFSKDQILEEFHRLCY